MLGKLLNAAGYYIRASIRVRTKVIGVKIKCQGTKKKKSNAHEIPEK